MSSVRAISVEEASITTMVVEVKALTIGKKQVTLAVFRQLPEDDLIDRSTGELLGLPWGTVNYHWSDCCGMGAHLWVVWQRANNLRRSSVELNTSLMCALHDTEVRSWLSTYAATVVASAVLAAKATGLGERDAYRQCVRALQDAGIKVKHKPGYGLSALSLVRDGLQWDAELNHSITDWWHYSDPKDHTRVFLRDLFLDGRPITPDDRDRLKQRLEDAVASAFAYRKAYAARLAELAALDQLFIAV